MNDMNPVHILTINSGSSSIKFSLYRMSQTQDLFLSGSIERIGLKASLFTVHDSEGNAVTSKHFDLPDHEAALKRLFSWLEENAPDNQLTAVGHRIVHGVQQGEGNPGGPLL